MSKNDVKCLEESYSEENKRARFKQNRPEKRNEEKKVRLVKKSESE